MMLFLQEADGAAAPEANQEDGKGLKKSASANDHRAFFSLFVICVMEIRSPHGSYYIIRLLESVICI